MSTNSNQKFHQKKKKTKIIPSLYSSSSFLFHKFLQTQYRINVLNTVLLQSEFFIPVKVTPLFYYVPKFGLYWRFGQRSQYRFISASITIIFHTGEQYDTSRPLFHFVLNTGLFRFVLAFPVNFGDSGRKMCFGSECNSSATWKERERERENEIKIEGGMIVAV